MSSQVRILKYICRQCQKEHNGWVQPCQGCGGMNTLQETRIPYGSAGHIQQAIPLSSRQQGIPITPQVHGPNGIASRGMVPATQEFRVISNPNQPLPNVQIANPPIPQQPFVMPPPSPQAMMPPPPPIALATTETEGSSEPRLDTSWEPIDAITGGGMVLGSSILLSGPPGIGKSTLILQWLKYLSEKHNVPSLAVTGEETRKMVLGRARRVEAQDPRLFVARASSVQEIDAALEGVNPFALALDSLQAFTLGEEDIRGDLATSKEIARLYNAWAKVNGKLLILLCQVTKDGASAGPRAIEHLVDAHFMFEEIDTTHSRLVALKNRFGERKTISWHMTERGLLPWKEEAGEPS